MFCEAYNQSLKEAAANGESLSPALQQHLAACPLCRNAFAEEQSLFSAIDAGLKVAANSEVPATLIPRIRIALNNEPVPQKSGFAYFIWGVAGASVMAAVVLALLYLPHKRALPNELTQTTAAVPTQNAASPPTLNPVEPHGVSHLQHGRRVTLAAIKSADSGQPEILVPSNESESLQAYVQTLAKSRVGISGTVVAASTELMPLELQSLEITELKIKPLAGSDSD